GRAANSNISPLVGEVDREAVGRGVASDASADTPLPNPPPQGGREPAKQVAGRQTPPWLAPRAGAGGTPHARPRCAATGGRQGAAPRRPRSAAACRRSVGAALPEA